MQSFLFSGDESATENQMTKFINKNSLARLNFDLISISDVRVLNRITNLNRSGTAVVIKNIDKASEEALNAFLKNLEEPQKDLYYLLTCRSSKQVIPTILSRCQLVKTSQKLSLKDEKLCDEFNDSSKSGQLRIISSIKDRGSAIEFINDLIVYYHKTIVGNGNQTDTAKNAEVALDTLRRLSANGNVTLQLTNMITEPV